MSYPQQLEHIVEGALLAAGKPLTVNQIKALFQPEDTLPMPSTNDIKAALVSIGANCQGRGFELKEVAGGWRFQVREHLAPWINRLWEEKPQKYSRAMLETLALIAYRQPITRGEIEEVRGVAVSSNILRALMERDWVKIVGYKESPGRPSLLATTRRFLDYFNLRSLEELPSLAELADLTPATEAPPQEEGVTDLPAEAVEQSSANDADGLSDVSTAKGDATSEECLDEDDTPQDEENHPPETELPSRQEAELPENEHPQAAEVLDARTSTVPADGDSSGELIEPDSDRDKADGTPADLETAEGGEVNDPLEDKLPSIDVTTEPVSDVTTELVPDVASESLFSASMFDQPVESEPDTAHTSTEKDE